MFSSQVGTIYICITLHNNRRVIEKKNSNLCQTYHVTTKMFIGV